MKHTLDLYSDGTRIAADLFLPDDLADGEQRPAILLCHGWGGPKQHLSSTYAPHFCAAGFVCLTFDYRGWFDSDARLITMQKQPEPDEQGMVSVTARPLREIVDPLDQNRDINNALDYLIERAEVDAQRIGLWGSSFGGGHVIHVAGHDPRIKAVVSQVPGMGPVVDDQGFAAPADGVTQVSASLTRGDLDVVPRPPDMPDSLRGIGDVRTMWHYRPRAAARHIRVPTLILDQEEEEYGGRENSGLAAKDAIPASTEVSYHVFPGTHYDIYDKNYKESADMARDWFVRHLM